LRNRPAGPPHPFCLCFEHLASPPLELAPEFRVETRVHRLVTRHLHVFEIGVGGLPDIDDVELRAGALGQVGGGPGGEISLLGAVGGLARIIHERCVGSVSLTQGPM